MQYKKPQRLYWSISEPFRYMGLTIDEIIFLALVLVAGMTSLLMERLAILAVLVVVGIVGCMFLKKWKRLQRHFRLKSFLVANNLRPAPPSHPKMLNKKKVGR